MKLSYFELLSPEPVYIEHVGGILSPTLRVISQTGIMTYQYYVSVLLMEGEIFETLPQNPELAELLQLALDFFIKENVVYSTADNCFVVHVDEKAIGVISKDNYSTVCDLICQRISVKAKQQDDISKAKSKKAMEIMEKLQKGRASKSKQTKADKNLEIGNVISAVANRSQELAKDPYNQDLLDRQNELEEKHREVLTNIEDDEQPMIDTVSEGYDTLLDHMDQMIDKRKNMLSQAKDLYDYEKNIVQQTKEITSLEKQLVAYQGDDSEEARATIQKLQVSLSEAKDNLEETEYEKYISDQEEMLDTLRLQTEEWINARLDNEDSKY